MPYYSHNYGLAAAQRFDIRTNKLHQALRVAMEQGIMGMKLPADLDGVHTGCRPVQSKSKTEYSQFVEAVHLLVNAAGSIPPEAAEPQPARITSVPRQRRPGI